MRRRWLLVTSLAAAAAPARAEDDALSELQRVAARLAAALPDALPGWQAEGARSVHGFGPGIYRGAAATRRYRDGRGRTVEILVMRGNPVVGGAAAVLADPMASGARGHLYRIGGERALHRTDGAVVMVVGSDTLVFVRSDQTSYVALAYARAIHLEQLRTR